MTRHRCLHCSGSGREIAMHGRKLYARCSACDGEGDIILGDEELAEKVRRIPPRNAIWQGNRAAVIDRDAKNKRAEE